MTGETKTKPVPDKPAPIKGALEWIKQHPSVLLGIAAATGFSGEQLMLLLKEDQPGWMLGLVVLLWAGIHWGKRIADNVVALVNEFRDFRDETRERLLLGDGLLADLMASRDDLMASRAEHAERLGLLWDMHAAEVAAYREQRRRDTGKVPPGGK
ncbi:MAG: hypothetical protein IT464_12690 [Planctomycetes bacterium]|nr:hypothetical protein [Planctomycetota bacterium]